MTNEQLQLFAIRLIVDLLATGGLALLLARWFRHRLDRQDAAQARLRKAEQIAAATERAGQIAAATDALRAEYGTLHADHAILKAQMAKTDGDHAKLEKLETMQTEDRRRVESLEKAMRGQNRQLASIQATQDRHSMAQDRQMDLLRDLQITVQAGAAASIVLARHQVPSSALQSAGLIIDQRTGGVQFVGDTTVAGGVAGRDLTTNTQQGDKQS